MPRRQILILGLCAVAAVAAWAVPPLLRAETNAGERSAAAAPAPGHAATPAPKPKLTAEDRLREAEALARVKRTILNEYVDEVDEKKLFYGSLRGMVRELDPHSTFLTPQEFQDMTANTSGKFGGLGIEITLKDGWLTVVTPLMGTPAFKAGILPGDRIVKIDGQDTEPLGLEEAVHRMRGKPGTKVMLTVARRGADKLLDVEIVRQVIRMDSVRMAHFVSPKDKIGYVSVSSFQEDTAEELDKAMTGLEKEGLRALILDLRVNPGGRLDAAIKVSDLFLEKGTIVSIRGRAGQPENSAVYQAKKPGTHPDYPVAVLVNQSSASASEIVAGALRDHHRAVLVGEKTFGKGSVQSLRDVRIGDEVAGLKITTAYYYTPSGQCIHEIGIEPDIKVPMEIDVLAEVLRRQHDKWVEQNDPSKNGSGPGAAKPKAPSSVEGPPEKSAPEKSAPEKFDGLETPPPPEVKPAPEKNEKKESPEPKDSGAKPGAAADKAKDREKYVDIQLEAAVTALRAMLVDRDRGAAVKLYQGPTRTATGKTSGAPPAEKPVPEPVFEEVPIE